MRAAGPRSALAGTAPRAAWAVVPIAVSLAGLPSGPRAVAAGAEAGPRPVAGSGAAAAGGAGDGDPFAGPTDQWLTVVPGAERMVVSLEGSAPALLVRFDLDYFRAEVVVGKGSPPQRRTATDVRAARGAVAAVNGGFFDPNVVPLGLRISGGDQRYPLRSKADWGVLVLGGHRARIVHTKEYPPAVATATAPAAPAAPTPALGGQRGAPTANAATVARGAPGAPAAADASATAAMPIDGAIQVGPRLVANGQALKLRPQIARRTGVALDREGRFLTLVVSSDPVEANALAQRLAALGFDSALFLDGGPSTQLSLALGDARAEIPGAYPVPDWLVILGRSTSRRNGPAATPPARRSGSAGFPGSAAPADTHRP